jgi:hypothetical protein
VTFARVGRNPQRSNAHDAGALNDRSGVQIRTARTDRGVFSLQPSQVNSYPALILRLNGEIDTVVAMRIDDGLITRLYAMRNPEKLSHMERETARRRWVRGPSETNNTTQLLRLRRRARHLRQRCLNRPRGLHVAFNQERRLGDRGTA